MIEYALMAAILGIALITGLTVVETRIYDLLNRIVAALTTAGG